MMSALHWILVLKVETACFSETVASTYETTRRQNPRQRQHHTNRGENVKYGNFVECLLPFSIAIFSSSVQKYKN
jgi:hypothetical protein